MTKLTVVHPFCEKPHIEFAASAYCPNTHWYLMQDQQNFLQMAKTMYKLEKEKNEWIRKYDRLLRGLNYWRNKYLDSTGESK